MKQFYTIFLILALALNINVYAVEKGRISGDQTVCLNQNASITFSINNSSNNSPYTFTYTLDGVSQSTVSTPSGSNSVTIQVNTNTAGIFNYVLTNVTDNNNSSVQISTNLYTSVLTVTTSLAPTITGDFSICDGSTTQLTGSGNASNYTWFSNDINIATISSNGLVTAQGPGTTIIGYNNNSSGCSNSVLFTVLPQPTITSSGGNNPSICAGTTIQLAGSGTPASSNAWVSSSPGVATVTNSGLVTGISTGSTTITFTNSGGCSVTKTISILASPTLSGASNVCVGSTITLTVTGTGTPVSSNPWSSSNPSSATVSNSGVITGVASGNTIITYSFSNGCPATKNISVLAKPTITGSSSGCIGSTIQLSGSDTPASNNPWLSSNIGVATISNDGLITDVSGGTTTITYTNSSGCVKTKNITIYALPTVDFTFSNTICSSIPTQFISNVIGNGSFQYSWNFGNSNSAATANPTTTFSTFGCGITNYNVTLTVTDSNGCQSSVTHSINVNQQPEGDFFDTNPLVDPNDPLSFFNNCNDASASNPTFNVTLALNPSITSVCGSYVVDWGDSTSQTYSNVTTATQLNHTYLLLGTYNITITMIGTNGCQTVKTYFVKNISNPSGGIVSPGSTINLCMPTANLNFGISGWQNNSPNTQYSINWGDGTISPSISQEDIVAYMGTNINANYPVSHIYTSSSCAPPFNSPTGFTVTLSISNACGTTISTVNNVTTITKPIPTFTAPSPVCNGTNVFFTNTSTLGYGNNCNKITTWIWNFGDPASGTNNTITTTTNNSIPNVNHIFSEPGCYTVTLTANNSCTLSPNQPLIASQQVIVLPAPIASFTIPNYNSAPVCYPYSVTLNNTSNTITQCDPSFAQYLWQVTYLPAYCGTTANYSPLTSTATNPTFQFNAAGQYKITLRVTNNICGTNTSAEQIITIKQPPTVSINTISDYCATASINPTAIINSCSNITTNNPTYLWSFPGSNTPTSTALNPTNIQYTTPGTYTVTLEVTNECGTTTKTKSFTIYSPSVEGTASIDQTICPGNAPNPLTLTGYAGTIQWQSATTATGPWTNITGATGVTLTSSQIGILTASHYYQAVVTNGICPSATSNLVTIIVTPPSIGGTASANQTICTGTTPNALILAGNTGTIQWQSSSNNSTFNNIVGETNSTLILGSLTSTMYYQAIVTNSSCPLALSTNVTITVSQPSVGGTASADQTICQGSTPNPLILTGNTGTIQWQYSSTVTGPWTIIPGATSATLTSVQMGPLSSNIYYQAVVTSGACPPANSSIVAITVNPTSIGGAANTNQTICSGATPNPLTLSGYTGTIQWQSAAAAVGPWTNIAGQTNPSLVLGALTSTTYYHAEVINGVCPSATSSPVTITVNPLPTINGNLTICVNETTQLTGSATAATSNPWSSSNTSVATVSNTGFVTGSSNGTAVITYTNTNGCLITATVTVNPLPIISGTLFVCLGSTSQLTGNGSPATTTPWISSNPLVASINSSGLVTGNTFGSTIITYTNSNGCKATATITVNPLGQVNATMNQNLCDGGIVNVNFTTNSVTGTTTYNWTSTQTPNIGIIPSGTGNISFTASNIGSGIATSTVVVTPTYTNGGVGCPGPTSQFTISVYPPPTISVQPTPTQNICVGGTVPAFTVAYINGYGNPDYQWFFNTSPTISGATVISGAINPTYTPPSFLASGTYYYFARICLNGLGCGCKYSDIAVVNVYGDPNATITPLTQTVCQNTPPTSLVVTANGGIVNGSYTYLWWTNVAPNNIGATILSPLQTSSTFIPPTDLVGTHYYYCVVNGGLNCDYETAVVQVVTVAAPIAHIQPLATQSVCVNGAPTPLNVDFINGTGTPTYQWYSNSTPNYTGTAITSATGLTYVPPTSTIGTLYYYCIATYNTGGCTTAASTIAEVIVNPIQTITTQPLATQNICVGGTIAALTVEYTGGVGTATYQWYNPAGIIISGATASSYTPPAYTNAGDYSYYAMVTLSGYGCGTVSTNNALVHVVVDPTVTITPSMQTICQGATPTNLVVTPTGGVGAFSYQWYNSSSGTLITGAINPTYIPDTTSVGTISYYCVITQTGLGCSVTSSTVSVQVVAAPAVNAQPLATQTVCLNGAPTPLAITLINGTGTPTYQWYSNSIPNFPGTAITNATGLTYVPPTSATGTLYYYCIATYTSGGCTTATSIIAEVIVNPIQTITTQPLATQDICVGGTIAALTVEYTGGVGTATYQWYSNSTNTNTGGLPISGANASSYTPPTFTTAGYFYYYVSVNLSGSGCNSVSSNTAIVHVFEDPIVTISPSTQTICQGTAPANLVVTPTGGVGTYSYQWYNSSSGTLITGAINATYIPDTTSVGTISYYCVITQTGLGCSVTSSTVSVQVVAAPAVNAQPLATQTVCLNGAPTPLAITLINGTGTPTYQWYSNSIPNFPGTAITSATGLTYVPPTSATGTLYYYCIATYPNGGCGSAISNIAEVIVNPIQTITTQPLVTQDICVGGTIAALTVEYTGGVGTATYQWYNNSTNTNTGGLPISGANASSYTPPTFTTAGYFYYYVSVNLSGSGCNSVSSNTAIVHVFEDPIVTISPSTQTICQGTAPANLVVTPTGGVGTYSYQWYNSTSGTLITGAINATYIPDTTTVGTISYNCVITQTGLGCSVTSIATQVTVVAVPTISVQPIATQIICQNEPTTVLSVSVINGTGIPTYQWFSNTIPAFGGTLIPFATNATYLPSSAITGTTYFYCEIQYANGGCGSLRSNISEVEIDSVAFIPNKTAPICSGETFNVIPSGSAFPEIVPPGTQYIWFVDPISSPLVTGASDNFPSPSPSISQTLNNNDTVPHNVVYHVTPITGSCQGAPFTITITINPKVIPNEVIGNVQCNSFPPLCDGSITLNPTPTGTGVFTYQWSIPGTTTTQTNLCPGNYFVNITDSYSCTYHFPYTVTVPPAMISVPSVNPVNNTNCDIPTSCNGIIQVVITGGTPFASATNPYQFQWYEVSGPIIPITNSLTQVNTSILQNLCGGTYLLVVTDGVNCQRQFGPYTITNPAPLAVTSTVSNYNGFEVSCNGGNNGSIGINVTGGINSGISITLNPGGVTLPNPAIFSSLSAGSYTAVIHDSMNNCPDILRTFVLTQPATPVSATLQVVTQALCFGNQAIYQAIPSGGTGGYTFLWSNGITTPVVSNIPVGAFNCIITDSNGCQFTLNGTNTPPPLLVATATITTPIVCFGGTASISVSGTGGTPSSNLPGYFGDIGIHTGVPAGMSPIYTITDVNGCQATVSIPVTEPALLQVTTVIATPVACFGGNAIVTVSAIGGVPSYVGTGMVSVSAGINSFIVTDSNGCIKTAQLNVTQPTLLVATASVTSPILCHGNTGVITVSGSGGTPFNTLPLYSGTGPITVIAGVGGPYTISDANGCSAITAPITVTEPSQVIATATITSPILCKGGTAVVMVSATGGVVGTGYTGTGNYVVHAGVFTYIVKDSNNCVSSVTITVTEPTLLVANAVITAPILCHGGTATISVFGTGGTPAYSGNIGNHTVVAGTYTYNVLDSNGCFATTTITVTQPALLTFSIKSVTNPNCYPIRLYNNGSICITITGGTSPVPVGAGWVQSTTIPSEWCLSGLSAGPYTISVTDINNCITASQTVTLTRPTPLTAFATSNVNVNCPIKEVSQTNYVFANGGVPGYSYSWSGGNTCIPVNPQCMTTAVNGNYSAFVNDQEGLALGCIAVQVPIIVNLPVIGNPLMSISSNSGTICGNFAVNDPITLTNISTGNYTSVQWAIDGIPQGITNTLIHNFTTIGNHTITLVVNYAIGGVTCTYSVTETIAITKGYDMVVPNGFTPGNHDTINDTIKPEFNCMGVVEMQVYDTWGSLLYAESGTSLIGWDGTVNGHESENGNYIIVVKATTLFGAEINYNGPFTLLK